MYEIEHHYLNIKIKKLTQNFIFWLKSKIFLIVNNEKDHSNYLKFQSYLYC